MQRHQPVLAVERPGVVPGERCLLEVGAEPRRDVRHHADAPGPAVGVGAERAGVLAGNLNEISAARYPLVQHAADVPVASLTPTIRGSRLNSPIVAGAMSITDRPGML